MAREAPTLTRFGGQVVLVGGQVKLLSTCPPGRWLKKIMSYPGLICYGSDQEPSYSVTFTHGTIYMVLKIQQRVNYDTQILFLCSIL